MSANAASLRMAAFKPRMPVMIQGSPLPIKSVDLGLSAVDRYFADKANERERLQALAQITTVESLAEDVVRLVNYQFAPKLTLKEAIVHIDNLVGWFGYKTTKTINTFGAGQYYGTTAMEALLEKYGHDTKILCEVAVAFVSLIGSFTKESAEAWFTDAIQRQIRSEQREIDKYARAHGQTPTIVDANKIREWYLSTIALIFENLWDTI